MAIRFTHEQMRLYVRAKQALAQCIRHETRNGVLADNKLPAEEELCRMLGVSRPTVREALMALNRDGIVSNKHGTGNLIHRGTRKAWCFSTRAKWTSPYYGSGDGGTPPKPPFFGGPPRVGRDEGRRCDGVRLRGCI